MHKDEAKAGSESAIDAAEFSVPISVYNGHDIRILQLVIAGDGFFGDDCPMAEDKTIEFSSGAKYYNFFCF